MVVVVVRGYFSIRFSNIALMSFKVDGRCRDTHEFFCPVCGAAPPGVQMLIRVNVYEFLKLRTFHYLVN